MFLRQQLQLYNAIYPPLGSHTDTANTHRDRDRDREEENRGKLKFISQRNEEP